VLHLALQTYGYQVALTDSADTALELAGHEHPDLVVLDLGLPGIVDVAHALRQAGAAAILLLTWSTQPHPQATLGIGANDALTKPFSQLLERLQTMHTPAPSPPGQRNKQAAEADGTWMRS